MHNCIRAYLCFFPLCSEPRGGQCAERRRAVERLRATPALKVHAPHSARALWSARCPSETCSRLTRSNTNPIAHSPNLCCAQVTSCGVLSFRNKPLLVPAKEFGWPIALNQPRRPTVGCTNRRVQTDGGWLSTDRGQPFTPPPPPPFVQATPVFEQYEALVPSIFALWILVVHFSIGPLPLLGQEGVGGCLHNCLLAEPCLRSGSPAVASVSTSPHHESQLQPTVSSSAPPTRSPSL